MTTGWINSARVILGDTVRTSANLPAVAQRLAMGSNRPESVYFYTLHKCASSLFANYVLRNLIGLRQVDYAWKIYRGMEFRNLKFKEKGCVYGPLRLSSDPEGRIYKQLDSIVAESSFIRDKKAVFFIRDPRDILVSAYYSYGFTHGTSRVAEIREHQEVKRAHVQSMTLDEYAIESASEQLSHFERIHRLSSACPRCVVLRFEDMISHFDEFILSLSEYFDMSDRCKQNIYERSRPRSVEDDSSHRRSGKVSGYKDKLQAETVETLNRILSDPLERFGYDV